MTDDDHHHPPSVIDDLVDEYRDDALRRLGEISAALAEISSTADDVTDHAVNIPIPETILHHAHSLKGTSGTFGFHGLSLVAHVMDDLLQANKAKANPALLGDLERLTKLMTEITGALIIVPKETARQMLDAIRLETPRHKRGMPTASRPTAILMIPEGDARDSVVHTLEILGVSIIAAVDGVAAIELATVQRPDIILMTLHNGRERAAELIRVFGEINATSDVPTVVVLREAADTDDASATEFLINELPSEIRLLPQGAGLGQALKSLLIELDIITPS